MREIKFKDKTVAIFHQTSEWKEGLDFLTSDDTFIQAGTWWYQNGKELLAHKHLEVKREALVTQETIVIISGRLLVELYDDNDKLFHSEELKAGDIGVMLSNAHGYKILEDNTRVVELKNGPYPGAERDRVRIK